MSEPTDRVKAVTTKFNVSSGSNLKKKTIVQTIISKIFLIKLYEVSVLFFYMILMLSKLFN